MAEVGGYVEVGEWWKGVFVYACMCLYEGGEVAPIAIGVEFPNVIALPVLIGRQEPSFVFDFDNFEPRTQNPEPRTRNPEPNL